MENNQLAAGYRLQEFEIRSVIGVGGFSIVYLALDHTLECEVALKEYMPGSLATRNGPTRVFPSSQRHREDYELGLQSFVKEARLLRRFDHPALVKVHRFWEENGTAYIAMPRYTGQTVKQWVTAHGHAPPEEWLRELLCPLVEALNVLHREQWYHRDIAPDNILILEQTHKPLLLDFGAARQTLVQTGQQPTGFFKGGYTPYEQAASDTTLDPNDPDLKQGPWTDVYALSAMVHWIITGRTPPMSVTRLYRDTYIALSSAGHLPYSAGMKAAIDHGLAVLPSNRIQSLDDWLEIALGRRTVPAYIQPRPLEPSDPDATVLRPRQARTVPTGSKAPPTAPRLAEPSANLSDGPTIQKPKERPRHPTGEAERDRATGPQSGRRLATRQSTARKALLASAGVVFVSAGLAWLWSGSIDTSKARGGDRRTESTPDAQAKTASDPVLVPAVPERSPLPALTPVMPPEPQASIATTEKRQPSLSMPDTPPPSRPTRTEAVVTPVQSPRETSPQRPASPPVQQPPRQKPQVSDECARLTSAAAMGTPVDLERLKSACGR